MADVLPAAGAAAALSTASDLDAALDAGLLTVLYQPVVDLATGRVVAAEALARLTEPGSARLRTPDTFIPLAERTGRIARIDRMVLEQAAPVAVACRRLLPGRPFSVGVNASVHGLTAALPSYVAEVCARTGLPTDALIIEVTETVLSTSGLGHEQVLQALHDLGCNVTMDDFGTGYSSLSHLVRFPVDGIKIDREFVWGIGRNDRAGAVASALVGLGADLGVHVVAEGVETDGQLRRLLDAGCPFAQGYLFSRPLPVEDLLTFVRHDAAAIPLQREAAG